MSTKTMSEAPASAPEPAVLAETPDTHGAYPRLSVDQIAVFERAGTRRTVSVGDTLIQEGVPCDEFVIVLSGKVAITAEDEPGERRIIRVHGPRRFLGELGTLEGQAAFFTAEMLDDGEVLAVPTGLVCSLVAHDQLLSDLILRAYLMRRFLLIGEGAGFRIIGSCYSPDIARLREFAVRNRLPHKWLDVERDHAAERLLHRFGLTPEETPVVIWAGKVLRNPTNEELARLVGLPVPGVVYDEWELVVVGAGPAGLAAAVYGASDGLRTSVLELIATGGQAGTSSRIENYLGFPAGISGADLTERAVLQAEKFGVRLAVSAEATGLDSSAGQHRIRLADDSSLISRAAVLATGARYRKLDVPGIEVYEGNGVYYAATYLEAMMCGAGPVVVVGGGNSAGQATIFLASHVSEVHLVIRDDDLSKKMSRYLVDQIQQHPQVTVHLHNDIREVHGDAMLNAVVTQDNRSGDRQWIATRALFVFIGAEPKTTWLQGVVALDRHGFVLTGLAAMYSRDDAHIRAAHSHPMTLETSRIGVFAAGDVRSGSTKRVAAAVGEGSMAIHQIHERLVTTTQVNRQQSVRQWAPSTTSRRQTAEAEPVATPHG